MKKKLFYIILIWLAVLTINVSLIIVITKNFGANAVNVSLFPSLILSFVGLDLTKKIWRDKI